MTYKIIKSNEQYNQYCNELEHLLIANTLSAEEEDTVDLLTLLIEKWDEEHNTFADVGPITLLKYLLSENDLKPVDLAAILQIRKGLVSEILNYKKGLSKEVIRKLADYFKLNQSAFNRPYKLVSPLNSHLRNSGVMNTVKKMEERKENKKMRLNTV